MTFAELKPGTLFTAKTNIMELIAQKGNYNPNTVFGFMRQPGENWQAFAHAYIADDMSECVVKGLRLIVPELLAEKLPRSLAEKIGPYYKTLRPNNCSLEEVEGYLMDKFVFAHYYNTQKGNKMKEEYTLEVGDLVFGAAVGEGLIVGMLLHGTGSDGARYMQVTGYSLTFKRPLHGRPVDLVTVRRLYKPSKSHDGNQEMLDLLYSLRDLLEVEDDPETAAIEKLNEDFKQYLVYEKESTVEKTVTEIEQDLKKAGIIASYVNLKVVKG